MSTDHSAQLVYGIDLGHSEKILVEEASQDGFPALPWIKKDEDGWPEEEFIDALFRRLFEAIPDRDLSKSDPYWRIAPVREHFGVEPLEHGWLTEGDSRSFVLAAHVITIGGGDTEPVNLMELIQASVADKYDAKLAKAVRVLGITPKKQPSWLLLATR